MRPEAPARALDERPYAYYWAMYTNTKVPARRAGGSLPYG